MGERQFTADVYLGIKARTESWLKSRFGFGYQKVCASYTRADQQAISLYCNRNVLDKGFIAADGIIDLVKATGDASLLAFLADLVGYRLWPKSPGSVTGESLGRLSGKVMKETGDVIARHGEMVDKGIIINPETSVTLRKEIREAIDALVLMDMQVEEYAARQLEAAQ